MPFLDAAASEEVTVFEVDYRSVVSGRVPDLKLPLCGGGFVQPCRSRWAWRLSRVRRVELREPSSHTAKLPGVGIQRPPSQTARSRAQSRYCAVISIGPGAVDDARDANDARRMQEIEEQHPLSLEAFLARSLACARAWWGGLSGQSAGTDGSRAG